LEDASIKSAAADVSQKNLTETNYFYSSASGGRQASEKRR
jgi:hypothetical protein